MDSIIPRDQCFFNVLIQMNSEAEAVQRFGTELDFSRTFDLEDERCGDVPIPMLRCHKSVGCTSSSGGPTLTHTFC